eukprot:jgi/Psemu1/60179/gm1.60179_g
MVRTRADDDMEETKMEVDDDDDSDDDDSDDDDSKNSNENNGRGMQEKEDLEDKIMEVMERAFEDPESNSTMKRIIDQEIKKRMTLIAKMRMKEMMLTKMDSSQGAS